MPLDVFRATTDSSHGSFSFWWITPILPAEVVRLVPSQLKRLVAIRVDTLPVSRVDDCSALTIGNTQITENITVFSEERMLEPPLPSLCSHAEPTRCGRQSRCRGGRSPLPNRIFPIVLWRTLIIDHDRCRPLVCRSE